LLVFAIGGTSLPAQAQTAPTDTMTPVADTTTNAVKKVKHKKKKVTDTNAPAMTTPSAAPALPAPSAAANPTATTTTATTSAGHNKSGVLPFHGKLKAVDAAGGTLSVGTRTFEINSETIIIKNGKPATLADGVVGDETGGAYKKTADGKLVITKLRFGPKTADESTK
jgi:hypothetical protein